MRMVSYGYSMWYHMDICSDYILHPSQQVQIPTKVMLSALGPVNVAQDHGVLWTSSNHIITQPHNSIVRKSQ